jgi:hypothetical protein
MIEIGVLCARMIEEAAIMPEENANVVGSTLL